MNEQDPSHQSSQSVPCGVYAVQIKILSEMRRQTDYGHEINAINSLLVGATTTFVENFMANLILSLCYKSAAESPINKIHQALISNTESKINRGTFSEYKNIFQSLTGKGFEAYSNQSSWAAVNMLFKLRNKLFHGREVKIKYYPEDKFPLLKCGVMDKMDEIQKYLNANKLLPTDSWIEVYDVISNKVMYHFMKHSHCFANECIDALKEEYGIRLDPFFIKALESVGEEIESIKDQ